MACSSAKIAVDDGGLDQKEELAVSFFDNGLVLFSIVSTNEKLLSANAAAAV